jgi:hypothetical protein
MRKLFLVLIVLFALFVFINASAGVAADRVLNSDPPSRVSPSRLSPRRAAANLPLR